MGVFNALFITRTTRTHDSVDIGVIIIYAQEKE